MTTLIPGDNPDTTAWNALTYFNFYRFLIAFLFVALFWIGQLPEPLGVYDKTLFSIAAHVYLFFSIVAQFFVRFRRPSHAFQVAGQVVFDIIIITLMMYASAGVNSGFGMLLIIAVAGGGLLCPGKIGYLYAAMSTIAVLGQEVYSQLNLQDYFPNYTHAGILGITFFLTAYISQILAGRVEKSEALAEKRGIDLEKLAQLNESIVQRLQSGIIVIDEDMKIRLMNESAQKMLGLKEPYHRHLEKINSELAINAGNWKLGSGERNMVIQSAKTGVEIQSSFVPLNLEENFQLLIFLDDVSRLRQHAQQMKLASLGRLTASIAHEIRNPLGAISHASQLLSESLALGQDDKRLTGIIEEHSKRVNNIIENIMGISRQERTAPVIIELTDWLESFVQEFISRNKLENDSIRISNGSEEILARMDPTQLHQIVWNLMENGIRYSRHNPLIEIKCANMGETNRPYIEITDHGPGIPKEIEQHLFEPFFTTDTNGTGLGLYIARELCEANQATLNLADNTTGGCCFRIYFSHPGKQHTIV